MPIINGDIKIKGGTVMDNLATTYIDTPNTDLNDFVSTGSFWFNNYYLPDNRPENVEGWLQVLRADSTTVKQIWYTFKSGNSHYNIWERTKTGRDWNAWKRLMYEDDNTRSAILCYLGSETTLSVNQAWGFYRIPVDKVKTNIGDKFTLSSAGNIVYTGNRPVKITVHAYMTGGTPSGQMGYPASSADSYYEDSCTESKAVAVHESYESAGAGTYGGFIRPSKVGTITLLGNGSSPYTYVSCEEL